MESFSLIFPSILVLCVSIFLVFFFGKSGSAGHRKLPPGSNGWPIIGETLCFTRLSPQKFISDRMEKYSEKVFRTLLLGEKMAVFCGPEGNKFLFSNMNKLLTVWWPPSILNPLIVNESLIGFLKESSLSVRGFLNDQILKADALKHYIPIMDSMARQQLETDWSPYREVKVYPLIKKYTFSLACRIFLGVEEPERVKTIADPFKILTMGLFSAPINLPGTAYNRTVKAGKIVHNELIKIIMERKNEVMEDKEIVGRDFLSYMLCATNENGRLMGENEISNVITTMLFASYETTSAALTFTLKYLARLPHIYDKVHAEQIEIAKSKSPKESLSWDDIQKMKYSWKVACEAMRLMPPAKGGFKEATVNFTYDGFTVPKGWKVFWSVYSTHRDPKYFVNPEEFDPSRFEGSGPAPYTYVPFGGGPRMCPGKEYARLEILVFIHNMVTRFKLKELLPDEEICYTAVPVPKNDFPVQLFPHEKTYRA